MTRFVILLLSLLQLAQSAFHNVKSEMTPEFEVFVYDGKLKPHFCTVFIDVDEMSRKFLKYEVIDDFLDTVPSKCTLVRIVPKAPNMPENIPLTKGALFSAAGNKAYIRSIGFCLISKIIYAYMNNYTFYL